MKKIVKSENKLVNKIMFLCMIKLRYGEVLCVLGPGGGVGGQGE